MQVRVPALGSERPSASQLTPAASHAATHASRSAVWLTLCMV